MLMTNATERTGDHCTVITVGPSYRVEWGVHCLTDEEAEALRRYIADLKDEVADLKGRLEDAEHEESVAWDRVRFAERERDDLRDLVRDVALLAGLNGCEVTKMQLHAHGGDWRTIWERMSELGVPGAEVDHD